ncbi:hypothetical protein, partial [Actinomyces faecalis]|uniref:hypothetical protein n=1 Tax=Actinomyces faecalis TaxID=2722820 RepID=UPI001C12EEA2
MLFENSIVCHVFYAIVGMAGLLFLGSGCSCFVFGLPAFGPVLGLGWVGPGLVFWAFVLSVGWSWFCVGAGLWFVFLFGEFDPGS